MKSMMCLIFLAVNFLIILMIKDLFIMWLLYEMMTLVFIIYLNLSNNMKQVSIFYYIISVLSSLFFIMILYIYITFDSLDMFFGILIQLVMLVKLGMFPFQQWMIYLYEHMSWEGIFYMSTIMKIIPMYFLSMLTNFNEFFLSLILMNMIYSTFMLKNFSSLKMFISCSSINQSSFLLILVFVDVNMYIYYFIMYMMTFYLLIYFMEKFNVEKFSDLVYIFAHKKVKIYFMISCLIYSFLPPFMSLSLKWIYIKIFFEINLGYYLVMFVFLLMSVIVIWNYMRIIYYFSHQYTSSKKFFFKNYFFLNSYLIMMIILFNLLGILIVNVMIS